MYFPLYKGKPRDFDELARFLSKGEITEAHFNALREKYHRFVDEMKILFQDLRKKRNQMEDRLDQLRSEAVKIDVEVELDHLRSNFRPQITSIFTGIARRYPAACGVVRGRRNP